MSSNHLRHCSKHRKPLPCAHCALIAAKTAVVAVDEIPTQDPITPVVNQDVPVTEPLVPAVDVDQFPAARKKPGPKPKYANDNERKLAHKKKNQEPERQRMIKSILRKIRAYISKPIPGHTKFWEMVHNNREWLTKLRADLNVLTYVEVKTYYDKVVSKKGIQDSKGRLPGERSGEASQTGGMSELERIFAAIERDANGHRVRPEGHGAAQFEGDSTAESVDSTGHAPSKAPDDWYAFEDRLERAAQIVAEREWNGPRVYELMRCESLTELTEHVLARYRAGEKAVLKQHQTAYLYLGEGAPRVWTEVNRYYREVGVLEIELREADKAEGAKARKLARLAREAREDRNSSPPAGSA